MLNPWVTFEGSEVADIRAVFGRRGVEMAESMEYELGEVDRVLKDDNGHVFMELTPDGAADPFIRIHEFAHYYHCRLFPFLSEACLPYRAEAVGFLAEQLLIANRSLPEDWVEARMAHWEQVFVEREDLRPILTVVGIAGQLPFKNIRGTVQRILRGDFG